MNLLRRLASAAPAALFLATLAVPNSLAVTIDWVTVGDPGNAGNAIVSGTPGAVSYEYRIMKYEWTNSQYVQFLNAVDPQGTNPNGIYSNAMAINAWGGIAKTGTTDGSRYVTLANFNDKPVAFVSWWSAARVANWLQAGGLTYATSASGSAAINDGVYTLNGGVSGTVPAKNPGASYWIPTGDEWYKAAFYKGSGTSSGYWVYSPQSDVNPTKVNATAVGTGSSGGVSPVTAGNFANYDNGASWNGLPPSVGNLTTVGSNGGPSAYGAFDMSGNLAEWADLNPGDPAVRNVYLRGGGYLNGPSAVSAFSVSAAGNSTATEDRGFRLAAPVPEPTTYAMTLVGIACGGYSMWRRRKRA